MAALNIAFVINSLGGGGAERVVARLSSHLAAQGFGVLIICLNKAETAYPLHPAVRVKTLVDRKKHEGLVRRAWYAWLTFSRLGTALKEAKLACVIAFMTSANIWTALAAKRHRIPYIVSERNAPEYGVSELNRLALRVCAKLYQQADAVVLPSAGIAEGLKRQSAFAGLANYVVINNPVDRQISYPVAAVHPEPFILAVGRLNYQKGFDRLIDAYSKLGAGAPDLLIAGEGGERAALTEQISRLGLMGRVVLLGPVKELQGYYLQARLFVLSSRNEGYPNALIEAMSCGCACIAADCEFGPAEIIKTGENGLLVRNGDQNALVNAMRLLLKDEGLRKKIGRQAAAIAESNSIEKISHRWVTLLNHSARRVNRTDSSKVI
ncbi:glycosyltransferase family 4 protein [Pedobacter sp. SYP-B3415]|uniref:glycosyltransferase family 4 protein n=1 Tax=Pedobacter sp. SYP-B3415 TaxID=2496641 RepID=UPI00101BB53F|nr:glycosyltransferase family 4 protein [Pedobacter sp. SYP-B3415]